MKIILGLFLYLVFVADSFGSPLVFKVTKEIRSAGQNNLAEIGSFDSGKYKQIRIVISKKDIVTRSTDYVTRFNVYAVEDGEEIPMKIFDGFTGEINTPPTQIIVKTPEVGIFTMYIYASE